LSRRLGIMGFQLAGHSQDYHEAVLGQVSVV
jgi:hypothetical protein